MADRLIDLSHVIEHDMVTYRGLPPPHICDFWSRAASAAHYDDGSTFQIGRIDMVANTGTYVDAPFHRYDDQADLAQLPLNRLASVAGLVVRVTDLDPLTGIGTETFEDMAVRGKAILFHTGWDQHWRSEAYFDGHPFLRPEAAERLAQEGATLVGIDSYNIDDTRTRRRPVHTLLLGAGIPIVEHLTGLDRLPDSGFAFSAVPPKIVGLGSFPVRAFAELI